MVSSAHGAGFQLGWAESIAIRKLRIRTIMSGYRMQGQIVLADMYKPVHNSSFGHVFRFCEAELSGIPPFVFQESLSSVLPDTSASRSFPLHLACIHKKHPLTNGERETLPINKCLS
jgi:hypothetical protein